MIAGTPEYRLCPTGFTRRLLDLDGTVLVDEVEVTPAPDGFLLSIRNVVEGNSISMALRVSLDARSAHHLGDILKAAGTILERCEEAAAQPAGARPA